jgi:dienelactone hydrolase
MVTDAKAVRFIRERLGGASSTLRAAARTAVFVLKVLPMLPSRPVDWVTPDPVRERVRYPSSRGEVEAEVARPSAPGPHPGIVVCLGVVPFGVDHPQVPRLQEALTRAGFATLLYWSPAMRDLRLDPADIDDLALACDWLVSQPDVDAARSGLLGTCVGGSFALMAAAAPRIRDRIAFVAAFSPYASMRTLARDIATATWLRENGREPWAVDPLTRKVFLHSLTAHLAPDEATTLRAAFSDPDGTIDPDELTPVGRQILPLLMRLTEAEVDAAIEALPRELRARLDAMSPERYLPDLHAPLVVLMHDHDDPVIPRTESLRLRDALAGRPGLRYTEFTMFRHLDPSKVKMRLPALLRELGRFYLALYPVFRHATEAPPAQSARRFSASASTAPWTA